MGKVHNEAPRSSSSVSSCYFSGWRTGYVYETLNPYRSPGAQRAKHRASVWSAAHDRFAVTACRDDQAHGRSKKTVRLPAAASRSSAVRRSPFTCAHPARPDHGFVGRQRNARTGPRRPQHRRHRRVASKVDLLTPCRV